MSRENAYAAGSGGTWIYLALVPLNCNCLQEFTGVNGRLFNSPRLLSLAPLRRIFRSLAPVCPSSLSLVTPAGSCQNRGWRPSALSISEFLDFRRAVETYCLDELRDGQAYDRSSARLLFQSG